jgi:hypothetical protein
LLPPSGNSARFSTDYAAGEEHVPPAENCKLQQRHFVLPHAFAGTVAATAEFALDFSGFTYGPKNAPNTFHEALAKPSPP